MNKQYDTISEIKSKKQYKDADIVLIYPGSGSDCDSFWRFGKPNQITMIDPAPVLHFDTPKDGFKKFQETILTNLNASDAEVTNFALDTVKCTVKKIADIEKLFLSKYDDTTTTFPGFCFNFEYLGEVTQLVFIACWYERFLQCENYVASDTELKIFTFKNKSHVVYEHKSMISGNMLKLGVLSGGCLIWGLDPNNTDVEWIE